MLDLTTVRADAITELQSVLLGTAGLEEFLHGAARAAVGQVASGAQVTVLLRRDGQPTVSGSSDTRAELTAGAEQRHGSGPGLAAILTGELVLVPRVDADQRWPHWRDECARHGFRSALAVPAGVGTGALAVVLLSGTDDSWGPSALVRSRVFAEEAARSVELFLRSAEPAPVHPDVAEALGRRSTIDQALGVVMAENRCSATDALAILLSASQHRDVTLREVAVAIIEGVTGQPLTGPLEYPGP